MQRVTAYKENATGARRNQLARVCLFGGKPCVSEHPKEEEKRWGEDRKKSKMWIVEAAITQVNYALCFDPCELRFGSCFRFDACCCVCGNSLHGNAVRPDATRRLFANFV